MSDVKVDGLPKTPAQLDYMLKSFVTKGERGTCITLTPSGDKPSLNKDGSHSHNYEATILRIDDGAHEKVTKPVSLVISGTEGHFKYSLISGAATKKVIETQPDGPTEVILADKIPQSEKGQKTLKTWDNSTEFMKDFDRNIPVATAVSLPRPPSANVVITPESR